jgi:amino acid transporter
MESNRESSTEHQSVVSTTLTERPPHTWRNWLIGDPLPSHAIAEEAIGKVVGLAVFASDALSSTAYATQEILVILAAAGAMAFGHAFPISIAIVALLAIVVASYEQTIHAYPGGGGAYIVARDNLGELPAKTAGAALLTDYVLTVAVSVSAGVAQVASAFPMLSGYRVHLAVGLVLLVMLVNLRGVRESGTVFAIPTYFFVVMMLLTVGTGLIRYLMGTLGVVADPPPLEVHDTMVAVTPFLILHAFSSGTAALTGVEAISNGITAFKEPRSRNAAITLIWMAGILALVFLSITFISVHIAAVPSAEETVISQLARTAFGGRGALYLLVVAATTLILVMATNTSFAGFPRLGALLGADGFLPRQMSYLGSRLVFSRGIMALALVACGLIVVFRASVTSLIPLYAIGVFLSFTLSQVGMARRWWKIGHLQPDVEVKERGSTLRYEDGWQWRMVVNGFGAACTAIVMLVFAVTKFAEGAWVVLILIPALVWLFGRIRWHYSDLARRLSLEGYDEAPQLKTLKVIIPISGVHRGTLAALRYARFLSDNLLAVYICTNPDEADSVREKWEKYAPDVPLRIVVSPYRLLLKPLLDFIRGEAKGLAADEMVTVIVPQFVPRHFENNLLHTQTAWLIRTALLFTPSVVVTDVPYQV